MSCGSAYRHTFEAIDRRRGTTKRFVLQNGPAQVNEIHIPNSATAVIVGRYQSSIDMVVIVGAETDAVRDSWPCFNPSV